MTHIEAMRKSVGNLDDEQLGNLVWHRKEGTPVLMSSDDYMSVEGIC